MEHRDVDVPFDIFPVLVHDNADNRIRNFTEAPLFDYEFLCRLKLAPTLPQSWGHTLKKLCIRPHFFSPRPTAEQVEVYYKRKLMRSICTAWFSPNNRGFSSVASIKS